jgi:hypothetical protein
MLALYRAALGLRRELGSLGDGSLRWRESPSADLLVFERPAGGAGESAVICVANLGSAGVPLDGLLPDGAELVLTSGRPAAPAEESRPPQRSSPRLVPGDTCVWFTAPAGPDGWTNT